ncbi:succinyl-diaminopimelate desuccinylase [Demequina sp.]|uniref:succinyl-diaminopimelate desuccinylase n=1 Tax=Demequina sp. TaxID=2050685 RepID=UPI003D1137B7
MQLDPFAPVAELTRQLIDIPSVSGDEMAIADAVEAALSASPHLEVLRDGNAVVARTSLGRARRVIIAGHLDTVPIKDNVPSTLSDDGTEIVGRGSVDMKAGVAVALSLAVELTDPVHDVTWVFYDLEEVEATRNGLGRVSRNHPEWLEGHFAILGEPTSGVIEGGCNGTLRADVRIGGVAAHSARSWKGVNAIHGAAPLLATLATYTAETLTVDGLDYREGLNAVGIRGGIAGNVVPDECVVTVNYRFAPAWSIEEAQDRLKHIVAGAGLADWDLTFTDLSPGARPGLDDALAADFVRAVTTASGSEPRAKLGWTDVARFGELGIPAVNFGPGDPERAHADDERCPISDIETCRAALAAWLT